MTDDFPGYLEIVKPKRASKITPSRRPRKNSKAFKMHAERVGRAVLAWNDLHASLYMIFWFLIQLDGWPATEQTAHGIWHTIQSDKTQREMLKAAAKVRLAKNEQAFETLSWILKQTEKLSAYRNIGAHTAIIFHRTSGDTPKADPWSARTEARKKFAALNHDDFWAALAGDLMALAHYAENLAGQLWQPDRVALLRKPQLQATPLIQKIEAEMNPERRAQALGLRKSSSPPKGPKGRKPKK